MSIIPKYRTRAEAMTDFAAGRCPRWVYVDGWQVDLITPPPVLAPVERVEVAETFPWVTADDFHRHIKARRDIERLHASWPPDEDASHLVPGAPVSEAPAMLPPSVTHPDEPPTRADHALASTIVAMACGVRWAGLSAEEQARVAALVDEIGRVVRPRSETNGTNEGAKR